MAKIGAVINAESGTLSPGETEARLSTLKHQLEPRVAHGLLAIVAADQVEREIRRIAASKPDVLIVGGGDGTISTGARIATEAKITLAVIGLGTRNHFVRDLGVPLDPVDAIRLLDRRNERRVDLGEVNGRLFINNASVGLYPKVVRKRRQTMVSRGWRKYPALVLAAATVLPRLPQIRLRLVVEGRRQFRQTPFLFVGNNEYRGRILAETKRSTLTGGRLWICTARVSGVAELAGMAWRGWASSLHHIENLDTFLANETVAYFLKRRVTVALDGENCILETPLRFTSHPGALRIVMP